MSKTFCATLYKTFAERLVAVCLYFDSCLVVVNKLDSTKGETRKVFYSSDFISIDRHRTDPRRVDVELFLRAKRERLVMSLGFASQELRERFITGIVVMNRTQTDAYRAFVQLDTKGEGYVNTSFIVSTLQAVGVPASRFPPIESLPEAMDIMDFAMLLNHLQTTQSGDTVTNVPYLTEAEPEVFAPTLNTANSVNSAPAPPSSEANVGQPSMDRTYTAATTVGSPATSFGADDQKSTSPRPRIGVSRMPSIALLELGVSNEARLPPDQSIFSPSTAPPSSSVSILGSPLSPSDSQHNPTSQSLGRMDSEDEFNKLGLSRPFDTIDNDNDSETGTLEDFLSDDGTGSRTPTGSPSASEPKAPLTTLGSDASSPAILEPKADAEAGAQENASALEDAARRGSIVDFISPQQKVHQVLPPPPIMRMRSAGDASSVTQSPEIVSKPPTIPHMEAASLTEESSSPAGGRPPTIDTSVAADSDVLNAAKCAHLRNLLESVNLTPEVVLLLLKVSLPAGLLTPEIIAGLENAQNRMIENTSQFWLSTSPRRTPAIAGGVMSPEAEQKMIQPSPRTRQESPHRYKPDASWSSVNCYSLRKLPPYLSNEITLFKVREATLGSAIATAPGDYWTGPLLITNFRWLFSPSFRPVSELKETSSISPISVPHAMIKSLSIVTVGQSAIQVLFTLKDCDSIRINLALADVALALVETPPELALTILLPLHPQAPMNATSLAAQAAQAASNSPQPLNFPDLSNKQVRNAILTRFKETVEKLAFPDPVTDTEGGAVPGFAWTYDRPVSEDEIRNSAEDELNGWRIFDPVEEYRRLKLYSPGSDPASTTCRFRLCTLNIAYELCATYPAYVVVPAGLTDAELVQVAAHRSRNRFPSTVYYYPPTGATLSRCAQPNSGIAGNRCREDEKLVRLLREANPTNSKRFYILDLRPYAAALGNQLKGKGTESVGRYEGAELKYLNIENIHAVRDAYEKLMQNCHANSALLQREGTIPPNFAEQVGAKFVTDHQEWLGHIHSILAATAETVRLMEEEGASVLVHCSDGWDRTSQVCALAQLILDPQTRTLRGFLRLIEKEWLSFGHQFALRHSARSGGQQAPIFLQFLDCVYQIVYRHPTAFGFTTALLCDIAAATFTNQFGTFLFDCEQHRKVNDLSRRTASLWSHILKHEEMYLSTQYRPVARLPFCPSPTKVVLWSELYLSPLLSFGTNPFEHRRITQQITTYQLSSLRSELKALGIDRTQLSPASRALLDW